MLDANLKSQLQGYLQNVSQPVELIASLDGGAKSAEMQELLEDIASVSGGKVVVRLDGADARKPSFEIRRAGTDIAVTFAGLPMGHEFTSLVLALLQVGGHPPRVEAEIAEQVKALEATSCSRPISHSPARTAPTSFRR